MATELIHSSSADLIPARLFAPTPKAARRVVEFFTAQINNDHTRKAYLNATRRFSGWCEEKVTPSLPTCSPSTLLRS